MTLPEAMQHAASLGRRVESIWTGWRAHGLVAHECERDGSALLHAGVPVHLDQYLPAHVVVLVYGGSPRDNEGCFSFSVEGEA